MERFSDNFVGYIKKPEIWTLEYQSENNQWMVWDIYETQNEAGLKAIELSSKYQLRLITPQGSIVPLFV